VTKSVIFDGEEARQHFPNSAARLGLPVSLSYRKN
jgi:hypothetical protein